MFLIPIVFAAAISRGAEQTSSDLFFETVKKQFKSWDKNRDGQLSPHELDDAVTNTKTIGESAAVVAALKRSTRSTKYTVPPLTLKYIRETSSEPASPDKPDFQKMFKEGLTRITNATNRELFATGHPQLATIHQGKLGNCFCLAPLGAMLNRNPSQVADMFTRQDDRTYDVKLGKQTVRVTTPTDAEIAMTSSNERDGIWINLYEKAMGEAQNKARPAEKQVGSPFDAVAKGGSAGTILAFITGHEITRFKFTFAKDSAVSVSEREAKLLDLRGQMTDACRQKRLMTCGTVKTTTPGLTPNHAYAILDYDAKADAIKLWNPHGGSFTPKGTTGLENGYPEKDGIFSIPLTELVQQFSGMAFEVIEIVAK